MYNFDKVAKFQNSLKWHVNDSELPMTLGDMDFEVAPEIITELHKRIENKNFGYEYIPHEYYASVAKWYKEMHNCTLDISWMSFSQGVVATLSAIITNLMNEDSVITVLTPGFDKFKKVGEGKQKVLVSELIYDKEKRDYDINWLDLEDKLKKTNLFVLCNPHSPVGKIWSQKDLEKILKLSLKYDFKIFSDEIHGEITFEKKYTPLFSLDEKLLKNTIIAVSPSKAFNIAGIQTATIITPNKELKEQVDNAIKSFHLNEANSLAVPATIAAYTEGRVWLEELKDYLRENRNFIERFLEHNVPDVKPSLNEASYFLWLDISSLNVDAQELTKFIRKKTGLILTAGDKFDGNGKQFLRMNIATSTDLIEDALRRLQRAVVLFKRKDDDLMSLILDK